MEQIVVGKKHLDWYYAKVNGKNIYFESIPIQSEFLDGKMDWDNKIILKEELLKHGLPVPKYAKLPFFSTKSLEKTFSNFKKPVVVKPQSGSRARHTSTNISTFMQFKKAVTLARQISPYLVVEEHLEGYICRATTVSGVLAGFYRGSFPYIIGDNQTPIGKLIEEKSTESVTLKQIKKVLKSFEGDSSQIPPMFSALKHKGEPLYKFARQGIEIERKPRKIIIKEIKITSWENPYIKFTVTCGSGTYIRSLVDDIGKELGCGGAVFLLRRTHIGSLSIDIA